MNLFQQTLSNINVGGSLVGELDDQLAKAIAAVKQSGKPASVSLRLDIKPMDDDANQVQTKAKVKLVVKDREYSAIFFTTDDDMLVRENPEQTTMQLQPVERTEETPRPIAKAS